MKSLFLLLSLALVAPTAYPQTAAKPAGAAAKTEATAPARASSAAAPTAAQQQAAQAAAAAQASAPKEPEVVQTPMPVVNGTPQTLFALRYIDTLIGTGPLAVPRKWYTVHYTGWLEDGTTFDSSVDRGEPITFPYGARQVIAGWDTGFEGMRVGGKRRLFIPYQLAYGEAGRPPVIPAKAMLIFDVELIGMSDTPPGPPPGAQPAANPAAAAAAASGNAKPSPSGTAPAANPATNPANPTVR